MPALTNVDDFGNYCDCATTLSSSGAEFLISVEDRNNDDVFVFRAKWFKAGGGTVDEIRILYKLPPTP
jgi:hypothetical protein